MTRIYKAGHSIAKLLNSGYGGLKLQRWIEMMLALFLLPEGNFQAKIKQV